MKQKFLSEFFGTAFLVMIVLGSGTMAQNLFPGQDGLALLANSLATGAGLLVLIYVLAPLSGAHLNPVVSFLEYLWKRLTPQEALSYIFAQCSGAYVGILLVHAYFQLPLFQLSTVARAGSHLLLSEVIATFGLIAAAVLCAKRAPEKVAVVVAAYITSAYWFTSSTSFANPAVTLARTFTNTFGGMSPQHLVGFVLAQFVGGMLAWALLRNYAR